MPQAAHSPTLTYADYAGMTAAQRADYLKRLSPTDRDAMLSQYAGARQMNNADYLKTAIRRVAICPPTSGGIAQNWVAGQQLVYDFPTAGGAFGLELLITLNLTITLAAGTGATYALNAAAPYNVIDTLEVLYNGSQARTRLYIAKLIASMRGYGRGLPGAALLNNNATIDGQLNSTLPVAVGANTWTRVIRLPLNALHPYSPAGALPIMGVGTKAQVRLTCASNLLGADPLINAISAASGTGNAVTSVTGTVKVECVYSDGTNLGGPQALFLDLNGEPTCQYYIDTQLSPLTAGTVNRQRVAMLLKHFKMYSIVIDGNQSTKFSALSNLTEIELDEDSVGQNKFYWWGAGTNQSIYDYYDDFRRRYGQDLDEGVIAWVDGTAGPGDVANYEGMQYLDMSPGHWTDVHHGYTVGSVGGAAGITPRVETFLVSLNPAGLLVA